MFKIYFIWLKKKTCLGSLERGEQGDDNETGLKEGGGIEMSIYKCFPYTMHALFISLLNLLYLLRRPKISATI